MKGFFETEKCGFRFVLVIRWHWRNTGELDVILSVPLGSSVTLSKIDGDRMLAELREFRTAPTVEPAKPIDPRKIGRLDRMPTVEEVQSHDGNWCWYSTGWGGFDRRIGRITVVGGQLNWIEPDGAVDAVNLVWDDGDTIEPIIPEVP